MKLYKLTDQNKKTHGEMEWGKGVTHSLNPKKDPHLCSPDVIHAYKNPNLAYLLNSSHADYHNPLLWLAEGEIAVEDFGKVGVFSLITHKLLPQPMWVKTREIDVQILFAILCAEAVLFLFEKEFPNDKRPRNSIEVAKKYLKDKSLARAGADAADAAADAADAAVARAADAAARAAAYAAHAAAAVARAAAYAAAGAYAAYAADAAHAADIKIDFGKLADMAVITIMEGK